MFHNDEIRAATAVALQAGVNVLLWGEPGEGKTSIVTTLARSLGRHLEVVIGSIREATDFGGLPVSRASGVELLPPAWAERLVEAEVSGTSGVLFLDELTTCHPAVQAAMLRVTLERVVGDCMLPRSTAIVAAANPVELAVDGVDLAPAFANRFCHLAWQVEPQRWADALLTDFWPGSDPAVPVLPGDWPARLPRWRGLISAFIRHRPDLLRQVPTDPGDAGRAWPSPRTWHVTTHLAAACEAAEVSDQVRFALWCGAVGEGAALELAVWLDELDLPAPEDLLAHPGSFDPTGRGDRVFAALNAAIALVAADATLERWNQAWALLAHVARRDRADIAATAARPLVALRKADSDWPIPAEIEMLAPVLSSAGLS